MYALKHGDVRRVFEKCQEIAISQEVECPSEETVRRCLNGDRKVSVATSELVAAAYAKLKPAKSARQSKRNAAQRRPSARVAGAGQKSTSRKSPASKLA